MSAKRYTVNTIRSGQPRAYADSCLTVRVTFEETDPMLVSSDTFLPNYLSAQTVEGILTNILKCGFISTRRQERSHGLESYLDYLKPIDPKKIGDPDFNEKRVFGKPGTEVSHVWEFQVISPFTD